MPIYEFECPGCGYYKSELCGLGATHRCSSCGEEMKRLMSAVSVIVSTNPGPKLKTRVALDDELGRQGFNAPLFKSEEAKDVTRWRLRKEGIKC